MSRRERCGFSPAHVASRRRDWVPRTGVPLSRVRSTTHASGSVAERYGDKDCRSLAGTVGDSATFSARRRSGDRCGSSVCECLCLHRADGSKLVARRNPIGAQVPSDATDKGSHRSRERQAQGSSACDDIQGYPTGVTGRRPAGGNRPASSQLLLKLARRRYAWAKRQPVVAGGKAGVTTAAAELALECFPSKGKRILNKSLGLFLLRPWSQPEG